MSPRTPKQFQDIREEKKTLIMDVALEHFAQVKAIIAPQLTILRGMPESQKVLCITILKARNHYSRKS